jgi:large repetitive protein
MIDVTVRNVAPTATFEAPVGGVEGSSVAVSLTGAADALPIDQAAGFTYAFDFGSGYGAFSASNSASFTPTDNGTYTVKAKVRDKDGGETEYTATVVIDNADPVANAGPDQTVNEGDAVTLMGSYTDAGAADTHTLAWSVSASNGQVIAAGTGPTFSFVPNDNGTYTVTFTVTDDDGGVGNDTAVITVNNVDPVITAIGNSAPTIGATAEGQTVTVSATFTDVGTADTHLATIDWGDGTVTAGVVTQGAGFGSVAGGHAYVAGGVYIITVTLTDDDGGTTTATTRVYVSGVGLHNGVLTIVGTAGADAVHLNQQGNGGLKVHANFLPGGQRNFALAGVQRVVALLGDGDDEFTAAGNMTLPMAVDGGAGNDTLSAGRGNNILIGGAGEDELTGGKGQDILIGGTTDFDGDPFALAMILAEWSDPTKSLAQRVANLTDGSGSPNRANGNYFLTNATVHDDGERDTLAGNQGADWFFANPDDDETDGGSGDLFGEQ